MIISSNLLNGAWVMDRSLASREHGNCAIDRNVEHHPDDFGNRINDDHERDRDLIGKPERPQHNRQRRQRSKPAEPERGKRGAVEGGAAFRSGAVSDRRSVISPDRRGTPEPAG